MQPGEGTVWTGQAAEPERAMTVECIQAGEAAFSLGQSSTSSEDLNDEIVSFLAYLEYLYSNLLECCPGVSTPRKN